MTGPGKATIETLQRLVDAFNAHDLDAVMSFFVDDPVLEMPRGPDPWGQRFQEREVVRSGLASRFAGLPDVHYGEDRHWVSGDRGCSEWLVTGTTTRGPGRGPRVRLVRVPGRQDRPEGLLLEARRAVRRYWDDHPGAGRPRYRLRGLQEAIDTTTLGGKLVFHVFAALAEFERDLIRETHHRPAAGRW